MNTPDVQLLKRSAIVASLLLSLAACGGGSSSPDPVPPAAANEVPASATASTMAYSAYAGSVAPSESSDPLSVAKVTAPTSETDEPIEVN
jgi:hypothetical protein